MSARKAEAMRAQVIRSPANAPFRRLLALSRSARERTGAGVVLLEGLHLLQEWHAALGHSAVPLALYFPERSAQEQPFAEWRTRYADRAFVLADRLFERVSDVDHGPGPITIVEQPVPVQAADTTGDIVFLDRIQDPGNAGTILRTCAATGLREIWCTPGTVSCWSPKVLRAAAGAHFRLSIREGIEPDPAAWADLPPAWATVVGGGRPIYECDLRPRALWLFGNEGQGLAAELARLATPVTIPQVDAVESLNVGVAAALCLYEQWRQRGFSRPYPS